MPNAFSKSESVPQLFSPSFKFEVVKVLPAEFTLPVESMIPFSNGKLEAPFSKYP